MSSQLNDHALRGPRAERGENGYMTVQSLCLVALVLAGLFVTVKVAESRINVAQRSQSFTDVRRASDRAETHLADRFNQSTGTAPFGANGTTASGVGGAASPDGAEITGLSGGLGDTSTSWWKSDPATGTVTITSGNDVTMTVKERAVRGVQYADTKTDDNGALAYAIPAGPRLGEPGSQIPERVYGLWGNAISTWKDSGVWGSWVNGNVRDAAGTPGKGTWGVYGGTVATWRPELAGQARFVTYHDGAKTPAGAPTSRSQMSAYFDRTVINKLMDQVRGNSTDCSGTHAISQITSMSRSYQCHKATSPTVLNDGIAIAGTVTGGVKTVVVKGDVTIKNNIDLTNSQLHLYVDGNVRFETPTNTTGTALRLNNVFIYAPNGECSSHVAGSNEITVNMTGSLACERVTIGRGELNPTILDSSFQHVEPWPAQMLAPPYTGLSQNVPKPRHVFFFERSGFSDQWTQ